LPDTIDKPLNIDFSDDSGAATLLGIDCATWDGTGCPASPDSLVTLTLHWQANQPFAETYTVFTHLLDPAETVLINADHAPPKPTQSWVSGEIIADTVDLTIPANLPAGTYSLEIGLYDAADPAFRRVPITGGNTRILLPNMLIVP
jgi:hypothetical protein